jgi:chemotaxis family two-component system sensor kinase Cph1
LPLDYPPAEAYAHVVVGMLMVVLPKPTLAMPLWFRPEVAQVVDWAGDPRKAASAVPESGALRLSPRQSFDAWRILSRYHSVDWEPHRILAVRELRRFAIELDLANQVRQAQRAVASRDELVAVVSHDLRSPLQVISLQAQVLTRTLSDDFGEPSRRLLAVAQLIHRATNRMSDMLRDLLDLSAIEQGRYSVDVAPHQVEDLFEDAAALLGPIAETKRIALDFTWEPGLVVHADAERIYQVFSNLVGNALKFTPVGGSVHVSAVPDPARRGDLVRFRVADTGAGMSDEQLAHIFERYWRVRDGNPTGTGLGLYITSGIVQAHGGSIWADSVVGAGSTLHFTLRRA